MASNTVVIARSVSDAAIQAPLDCFAALAMTGKGA